MKPYPELTRAIDEAKEGPDTVAFFDMDGTLLSGFTITAFFLERIRSGKTSIGAALEQFASLLGHRFSGEEYSTLLVEGAKAVKGLPVDEFVEHGELVFKKHIAGALYPESRALVRAHQARGHRVAIVSSATPYQITPVARELGIDEVMCNHFAHQDGLFTGELEGPMVFGKGKLEAASQYCRKHNVKLANAYFYSDGAEDIPLLEKVGMPRPTNPDKQLRDHARKQGWPQQSFSSRGIPGPREFIRTGLSYGSFIGAALSIAPAWALNRSRREAVNLATTVWGEFGTALSGITLKVTGEKYLWEQRPAVFVFNHQSGTDALIIAKLLRRDFTGIAKKELALHPLAGPLFRIADTVFVDRKNPAKAIKSMQSVTETVRQGLSIAVAPEGTRSDGDRLGDFKKGPFHIAREAGVPVVPIVIHNSTDVLPKSGVFIRPSRVYVDVLAPIDTSDWKLADIDKQVHQVRELFLEALGQSD